MLMCENIIPSLSVRGVELLPTNMAPVGRYLEEPISFEWTPCQLPISGREGIYGANHALERQQKSRSWGRGGSISLHIYIYIFIFMAMFFLL